MSTIVIADDHDFLRSGLQSVLESLGHRVVAAVEDGNQALAAIARQNPDIAVLDVRMPQLDGVQVLEAMRASGDTRPVIILTAEIEDAKLMAALDAKVNSIVLKTAPPSELANAIASVQAGERAIPTSLMERALHLVSQPDPRMRLERLTDRERQIAEAVASGQRNKDVAEGVGMTEGSIKVYLHRIYEKMGVENRTELAVLMRFGP